MHVEGFAPGRIRLFTEPWSSKRSSRENWKFSRSVDLCLSERVILNPNHIRFCNTRDMAIGALANRTLFGNSFVRLGVVAESEKSPIVCFGKAFTVLHHHIETV
jgi:hypothetical protein